MKPSLPRRRMCTLLVAGGLLIGTACAPSDDPPSSDMTETPESSASPAARVLGTDVDVASAEEMQSVILQTLLDRYAEQRGIEVEEEEIEAVIANVAASTPEDPMAGLSEEERAEVSEMRRSMATSLVTRWKIHRALHDEYGGRIIFQQFGPEPLDAYRRFLEQAEQAGDFEILREEWRDDFWRYFTDESMHSFYEPGSAEEAAAFETPPWASGADGA